MKPEIITSIIFTYKDYDLVFHGDYFGNCFYTLLYKNNWMKSSLNYAELLSMIDWEG